MNKQFSLMRMAKYFIIASCTVILAGIVCYFTVGFKLGIDFSGGSILTLDMGQTFTASDAAQLRTIAQKVIPGGDLDVSSHSDDAAGIHNQAVIRYQAYADKPDQEIEMRKTLEAEIVKTYPQAKEASRVLVGPTAGSEMRTNALVSVVIACVLMMIYVAIRFEFVYGISAIIALIHDVLIMAAVMIFTQTQLNSSFIAAMLTIVGYSMNDTIVLFDRVRENVKKMKGTPRDKIVDVSFLQTLVRTLNTSLTVFITLLALYILGVQQIKEFALPLLAGVISGTYSSILIAGPIWIWIHNSIDKRRKGKIAAKKQTKGGNVKKPVPAKSKA